MRSQAQIISYFLSAVVKLTKLFKRRERSFSIITTTEAAIEPLHRNLTLLPFFRRLRPGKDELIAR